MMSFRSAKPLHNNIEFVENNISTFSIFLFHLAQMAFNIGLMFNMYANIFAKTSDADIEMKDV